MYQYRKVIERKYDIHENKIYEKDFDDKEYLYINTSMMITVI